MIMLPPTVPARELGRGEHGDMLENRGERGCLGLGETQWRVVDDVDRVDAVGPHDAVDLLDELPGCQVPGHGNAAEGVPDHQVVGIVTGFPDAQPGITDAYLQVSGGLQAKLVHGDLHERRVELQHQARRAWVGSIEVARQAEPAAADVQNVKWLAVGSDRRDDVAEHPGIG